MLFLRILDIREEIEIEEAETQGTIFQVSIESPYRWRDWAAKPDEEELKKNKKSPGWKRKELMEGARGDYFQFINTKLLPYLKKFKDKPNSTIRQKVISGFVSL